MTEEGKKLSDEGIEKIRQSLNQTGDSSRVVNSITDDRLINSLNDRIKDMQSIISEKDKQIERLHVLLSQNNQLLLGNKQEKKPWSWFKLKK